MGRTPLFKPDEIVEKALAHFWKHGYRHSSIADLVAATGSNRQALYGEHGGKRGLFLSALAAYPDQVVDPAFAAVEAKGAGFTEIQSYFRTQIALAESIGLPGPGCFMANSMTELAPHDPDVRKHVEAHNKRLKRGFSHALGSWINDPALCNKLGHWLAVSAQGLWSYSRLVTEPELLHEYVSTLLDLLPGRPHI